MTQSTGRAILVGFIWLFGLKYYLEVRRLPDPTETMTISAVFWVFTAFAGVELSRLLRSFRTGSGEAKPFAERLRGMTRDRKTHLAVLTILYLFFIPVLGFFTTSALSFAGFSYVLGTRGVLRILIPDVLVLCAIYAIFSLALKLNLPEGLLV
jgi:hypothetical protein